MAHDPIVGGAWVCHGWVMGGGGAVRGIPWQAPVRHMGGGAYSLPHDFTK